MQATLTNVDVRVIVALDYCDPALDDYSFQPFTTAVISKRRKLTQRWNEMAEIADSDYLMLGNDDMRFNGPQWVDMVLKYDPSKPEVIGFKDGKRAGEHICFPILTRKGYEVQGFFVPEQFHGLFADTWLYDVGKRAGVLRYIPEYEITHLHWSNKGRNRDATDNDGSMRKGGGGKSLFENTANERIRISERFQNH